AATGPLGNSRGQQCRIDGIHGIGRVYVNIAINLSSESFRRHPAIFVASVALSVVLTLLLGVMIFLIVGERNRAKDARLGVERLDRQLCTPNAEEAQVDDTL